MREFAETAYRVTIEPHRDETGRHFLIGAYTRPPDHQRQRSGNPDRWYHLSHVFVPRAALVAWVGEEAVERLEREGA